MFIRYWQWGGPFLWSKTKWAALRGLSLAMSTFRWPIFAKKMGHLIMHSRDGKNVGQWDGSRKGVTAQQLARPTFSSTLSVRWTVIWDMQAFAPKRTGRHFWQPAVVVVDLETVYLSSSSASDFLSVFAGAVEAGAPSIVIEADLLSFFSPFSSSISALSVNLPLAIPAGIGKLY